MGDLLLPVAAIVALDAGDDAVEAELLADLRLNMPAFSLRAFRLLKHELLASRAIEKDIHDLLRQFLEGRVEVEAVMLRQAVHHLAVPCVLIITEGFWDERA